MRATFQVEIFRSFSKGDHKSMGEIEGGLKPGMQAPDFSLSAHDGQTVNLSDYQGEQHVVLFFMREFT